MQRPRIELPDWLVRLPLVSLGVAALWLLLCLVVEVGYAGHRRTVEADVDAAVRFALDQPAVAIAPRLLPAVRSVMPGFESNEMFDFLRGTGGGNGGPTPQEQFDALAFRAFDGLDGHPLPRARRRAGAGSRCTGSRPIGWSIRAGCMPSPRC